MSRMLQADRETKGTKEKTFLLLRYAEEPIGTDNIAKRESLSVTAGCHSRQIRTRGYNLLKIKNVKKENWINFTRRDE